MDRWLDRQRVETDKDRRDAIWCDIVRRLNSDVPFLYRGGRRFHYVARRKIMNMTDSPGFMVDLASAWLDEEVRFNTAAYKIEQEAAVEDFDCPDPGDVEAAKAMLLGPWRGKDSWGGTLQFTFNEDDTVVGTRSGGYNLKGNYTICGHQARWRSNSGALVTMTIFADRLEGTFERGGYGGTIEMQRDNG
jgi:hypothetical protein